MAFFTHGLKTWPEYFQEVLNGNKTFEIRKNDRPYTVGDRLILNEWDPKTEQYTGRRTSVRVTYITNFAQSDNYIVMGIRQEVKFKPACKDHPYGETIQSKLQL